jgi:hypothetical protein
LQLADALAGVDEAARKLASLLLDASQPVQVVCVTGQPGCGANS